jgi:hypothetical protein
MQNRHSTTHDFSAKIVRGKPEAAIDDRFPLEPLPTAFEAGRGQSLDRQQS